MSDKKLKQNIEVDKSNISRKKKDTKLIIKNKTSIIPLISYKKLNVNVSVINYFTLGICLFVKGVLDLEWFKSNSNEEFYIGYFLIAGIILYIVGIFNWYEGKELIFLIDFIFSFYFILLFMLNNKKFQITDNENEKLHGTFYVIIFFLIICIAVSSKNKGILYTINYIILFIGYFFLFVFKYNDVKWIQKTYSYIFIVSGALFWLTGLLKIIDNDLLDVPIPFLQPSD